VGAVCQKGFASFEVLSSLVDIPKRKEEFEELENK